MSDQPAFDIDDVIEAFADGEPVDPAALDRALADPGGRAHLIDVIVLRKLVKRSSASVVTAGATRRPLRLVAAAALIVLVAGTAGYLAGVRSPAPRPAVAKTPAETALADAPPPAPPPAPTVVIRFKPGVDWTERGGH